MPPAHDHPRSESVQASINLWRWNREFAIRAEDFLYKRENEPYVEQQRKLGVEEGDLVQWFMTGRDDSDVCQPEADKIKDFCCGVDLDALQAEEDKGPAAVALLDERSLQGGVVRPRAYRGPLTAYRLFEELNKPVRALGPMVEASM